MHRQWETLWREFPGLFEFHRCRWWNFRHRPETWCSWIFLRFISTTPACPRTVEDEMLTRFGHVISACRNGKEQIHANTVSSIKYFSDNLRKWQPNLGPLSLPELRSCWYSHPISFLGDISIRVRSTLCLEFCLKVLSPPKWTFSCETSWIQSHLQRLAFLGFQCHVWALTWCLRVLAI